QTGALIEVFLDHEAAHACSLGACVEIERVDRPRSLPVSWSEAVGILVRVHVDRALQCRIVRDRIVERIVRSPASLRATSLTSSCALPAGAFTSLLRRTARAHAERQRQG